MARRLIRMCRQIWWRTFRRMIKVCGRSHAHTRHKRYSLLRRTLSPRSTWAHRRHRRYRARRGDPATYATAQWLVATALCVLILPLAVLVGCLSKPFGKRKKKAVRRVWISPSVTTCKASKRTRTSSHKTVPFAPPREEAPTSTRTEDVPPEPMPRYNEIHKETTATSKDNAPLSTPKRPEDRYTHKRLTVAGMAYCDPSVVAALRVGMYLDFVPEPDNPADPYAVMILCEGGKIGYVPKTDRMAICSSLRLGRTLYGAVTDIRKEGDCPGCEYEVWQAG